jgi:predicted porin
MKSISLCAAVLVLGLGAFVLRTNAADEKAIPVPPVSIYGIAHLTTDYTDDGKVGNLHLSSNSSRLGFKGGVKLDQFEVIYQLESLVNLDQSGDVFATRNSYVGVSGEYGKLYGGRHDTPFKQAGIATDLFIDRIGDYRNIAGVGGKGFDLRASNIILYETPSCFGLKATLAYATKDSTNYSDLASGNVCYKTNGLQLMAAYEWHGRALTGTPPGSYTTVGDKVDKDSGQPLVVTHATAATISDENETGIRFSASYKLSRLTLIGLYETLRDITGTKDANRDTYGGGFIVDLGADYALRGEYLRTGGVKGKDGTDAAQYAGAVDKKLSDSTTLYVAYALMDNGSASTLSATGGGHGDKVAPIDKGKNVQSGSFGIIYKF